MTRTFIWILLVALAILFIFWLVAGCGPTYDTPAQEPQYDASPQAQATRLKFIQKMQAEGVIYKIELPTAYPRVYVSSIWSSLNVDQKSTLINVVWTYYYAINHQSSMCYIKDSRTGADLGTFDDRGLLLR